MLLACGRLAQGFVVIKMLHLSCIVVLPRHLFASLYLTTICHYLVTANQNYVDEVECQIKLGENTDRTREYVFNKVHCHKHTCLITSHDVLLDTKRFTHCLYSCELYHVYCKLRS